MPEEISTGFIWLPQTSYPIYKLTVEKDGVEEDITSLAPMIEIEDGINEIIGRFSFEIYNFNNKHTGKWTGMEIVRFYADRASSATTLRFRGRIEKLSYTRDKLRAVGRSESLNFMNRTISQDYNNIECSQILSSLVTTYRPDTSFTTSNINASATNLTVSWINKPFWDAVNELSIASGFDVYLDANKDFHFFKSGTVDNNNEAIVHDQNLIEVKEFADDINLVTNKIVIYGANLDGIPILYTSEDDNSQSLYGIREQIINDSNMLSKVQAQEFADFKLQNSKDQQIVGEVKGVFCP